MGVEGLDSRVWFTSHVLNCARTIAAALWDSEVLHSGLPAEPDGIENDWTMDWNVDQPLNGDMKEASMDTQELPCPRHCFMEWSCNTSPGAK